MSVGLAWLLAWQVGAVVLMRQVIRKDPFTFLGPHLLVMMVLFHAGPELLLLFSNENQFRRLVTTAQIEDWLWVTGPITFVLVLSYVLVLGARRNVPVANVGPTSFATTFPLWQCLLATLPLYAIAVQGHGYVPGADASGGYVESGITGQFLIVGVVLTAYAALRKFPSHPLLIIVLQSVALQLLGQRTTVVGAIVIVAFLRRREGAIVTRRQKLILIGLASVGALAISAARVSDGREGFAGGSGPSDRVSSAIDGLTSLGEGDVRSALADDFVYRIDGNVYGALVLAALRDGGEPVGLATLRNTANLTIPSAVNPSKLETDVTARSEKAYINAKLELPVSIDFLPTPLGPGLAYFGVLGLYIVAAAIGGLVALVDRRTRSNSTTSTVVVVGVLSCIIYYERGLEGSAITMRGIVALAFVLVLVRASRRILGKAPRIQMSRKSVA